MSHVGAQEAVGFAALEVDHAGLPGVCGITERAALQVPPQIERVVELSSQVPIAQPALAAAGLCVPPEQMIEGPVFEHQHDNVIERSISTHTEGRARAQYPCRARR